MENKNTKTNKSNIIEGYLNIIDENHISDCFIHNIDKCSHCNENLTINFNDHSNETNDENGVNNSFFNNSNASELLFVLVHIVISRPRILSILS